ncbi:Stk1 family PASTA domain-containing Ser/Thr kinase [Saccharopolyspora sp. CA-218241]|uniref:Stk1 family PASTA domain-containing Ser/Thr kinase n=1 Tax=Saccharopolyspora sp. CA-218241 TaxID=3240027 RepID=UPI003D979125
MSSPRLLSNRYEIGDTLGYGGMSEVFRGRDIRLGRDVAVKILRADLARDPTFQLRFRREAQNAAALNHPAIVAVYDTGETESDQGPLPYIVMEYVDGRTLRDIVKTEGPLSPRRAMEVMADASAALDFSHRHGIVHRDVKPANIMITRSGAVKVMDFGIARALADGQAAVTQTAAVIGTAQYLSPEQARGESVDARSDVYASGCVVFELLTGEPPFTGDSPVAVAYQHVREDPRKPSDVVPTVPASLDAVVLKALSKNPANRYQSAAEMRADLVRVLSGQRPKAPMIMSEDERTAMMAPSSATEVISSGRHRTDEGGEPPEVDEEERRGRRKRWLYAGVTAACVIVFALVAWLAATVFTSEEEPAAVQVRNYVGMESNVALAQARADGWNATVTECASEMESVDKVVEQTPRANTRAVQEGRTLTLCKGVGPEQIQVPDLAGLTTQQASQRLAEVGLGLGDTEYRETDNESEIGKIMSWEPRGVAVSEGTAIKVVVGKEIETISVPDVRGDTYATAEAFLRGRGFTVNKQVTDSAEPADTVINQSPSGGSEVRPGSEITLVVSNGQQIQVPSLQGMSPQQAEQALKDLGWTGQLNESDETTNDENLDGKVVRSTPSAGQKINKNQSVTIYVGEYESSPTSPTTPDGILPPFN